jgi:hypothetical protein
MAIPINLLLWGCKSWALCKDLLLRLERFVNRQVRNILNLNMWHIKDEQITNAQLRQRFNNISSVQTLIDIRTMQFLGKLVRGKIDSPPRQMLIAFAPNTRLHGRPIKCNKESMWESLKRLTKDIPGIHIDFGGSLSDWYLDALDTTFWNKCIEHLRDTSKAVPERPNRNAGFNPRRSRRNRQNRSDQNHQNGANGTGSREEETNSVSPPRRNRRATPPNDNRDYDPANVGRIMYDSLKILGLGYGATNSELKAAYRSAARMYHPDQHNQARTGMNDEQALQLFQLINNANEYLKEKL